MRVAGCPSFLSLTHTALLKSVALRRRFTSVTLQRRHSSLRLSGWSFLARVAVDVVYVQCISCSRTVGERVISCSRGGVTDSAGLAIAKDEIAVGPGSGFFTPAAGAEVCVLILVSFVAVWVVVMVSWFFVRGLLFDSPGFFLTSLIYFFWLVLKRLSQFGDEFGAVQADGPDSGPAAVDTDVARLDVALADPGPAGAPGWFDAFGTEVVRL